MTMIPVETPQHLAAVGGAIAFGFAVVTVIVGAGWLVLASIGDIDREARPLLAVIGWVRKVHARIWPAVGGHVRAMLADDEAAGEWHPLDEEAGDGEAVLDHDGAAGTHASQVGSHADLPVLPGLPASAPQADASVEPSAGDLTTGDDFDTDTLRIFHEENEKHHVRPHDPPGPATPAADTAAGVDTKPPPAGPADLDALDLMIEAARQHTTSDTMLLPMIQEALGFASTACWEDHAWAAVRAGTAATA